MKRKLLWLCFGAYCAVMLWLLFGQRLGGLTFENYLQRLQWNLQPLRTIKRFWWALLHSGQGGVRTHAFVNLAGNVVMFVPLGVFLPLCWKKQQRLWAFLLTAVAVIVLIELIQLVTLLGTCDVDDLILNMVGVLLGWIGWKIAAKHS